MMTPNDRKTPSLVLINPPTTDPSEKSLYFPMALVTLAGSIPDGAAKKEIWDFDLHFRKVKNASEEDFVRYVQQLVENSDADFFGISSICSNFPMAIWLAEKIKIFRPDAQVYLGGPQPSSAPKLTLESFPFLDGIVVGEGEFTLQEMVAKGFDPQHFGEIPGLLYRFDGQIRENPKRELTVDLDKIPFPDYSLIDLQEYAYYEPDFYPHVEAGRGCPFRCTFCSTSQMWERTYRVRSPQRILEEMAWVHEKHGFRNFKLIHDNFTTSRKFVLDFCDYFDAHNSERFRWSVTSRTDCIDVARLARMKDAGCGGLFFGVESGSPRMQAVIKKNLKLEALEGLLKYAGPNQVFCTTAFIMGFPEEREEDLNASIAAGLQYKKWGARLVYFSKLSPLTGTDIHVSQHDKLKTITDNISTSPNPYGLEAVQQMIRDNPVLFSSFFHIPHPTFSEDFLLRLVEFCNYGANEMPSLFSLLLDSLKLQPLDVFRHWDEWAEAKGVPYYDFHRYSGSHFKRDFKSFIEDRYFGSAHSYATPIAVGQSF